MPQCKGKTKLGTQCQRTVKEGDYCSQHKVKQPHQPKNCDVNRYSPTEKDIDKCIYQVTSKHKGAELGKGEQGIAYVFDNLVIKVSKFKNIMDEKLWLDEACKSLDLGNLNIAPKIYRYFICGKNGFIVMDRLTTIKSMKINSENEALKLMLNIKSDIVRYKIVEKGKTTDSIDDLRLITPKQQLGFIHVLEIMINNNYIHMDNHIDNIGFIGKNPIVFDFGFTQKREVIDKRWALCFSIFQILEHCPVYILEQTDFYRVATACINNSYKWGHPESGEGIPLAKLLKSLNTTEKEEEIPFLKRITKDVFENDEVSPDLIVGSLAYAKIIGKENREGILLDLIYAIRNPSPENIKLFIKSSGFKQIEKLINF